jgi:hypothetical protein
MVGSSVTDAPTEQAHAANHRATARALDEEKRPIVDGSTFKVVIDGDEMRDGLKSNLD